MKYFFLAAVLASLCSCNPYSGHNGYSLFWQRLEFKLIGNSDSNGDGEVIPEELEARKRAWIKDNGLTLYDGRLYRNGEFVSSEEVAKIAGLSN